MEEDFLTLVRSVFGREVFWRVQPIAQKKFPFVNLSLASGRFRYATDATSEDALIQIDCWGERYEQAVAARNTVFAGLSGYDGIVGSTRFYGLLAEGERDLDREIGVDRIFGRSLDFRVYHESHV